MVIYHVANIVQHFVFIFYIKHYISINIKIIQKLYILFVVLIFIFSNSVFTLMRFVQIHVFHVFFIYLYFFYTLFFFCFLYFLFFSMFRIFIFLFSYTL